MLIGIHKDDTKDLCDIEDIASIGNDVVVPTVVTVPADTAPEL